MDKLFKKKQAIVVLNGIVIIEKYGGFYHDMGSTVHVLYM